MSSADYPVPSFAAYIWLAGDKLCLGLPPADGRSRGHTVVIPLAKLNITRGQTEWEQENGAVDLTRSVSTVGFATLLQLLHQRERDGRIAPIGARGEPTQYQLEAMMKALAGSSVSVTKAAPTKRAQSLADLGLE